MGCGKTTVGKALAKALGCSFSDLDEYIVKKENRSIPEIFADIGEAGFRRIEAEAVKEISSSGGVIATGGGAIINPDTARLARACGIVCFLDVPFSTCYERIAGDENRPIASSRSKEELEELYNFRREIYISHSDILISGCGNPLETAEKIIGEVK